MTVITLLDNIDQPFPEHIMFRQRTIIFGECCISASGPHLWNTLPNDLQHEEMNYEYLTQQLKTYLLDVMALCDLLKICAFK